MSIVPAHFSVQAATCHFCQKPVVIETECWRTNRSAGGYVHVLCLAAFILIDDSPSRLDYEIADEVNERAEELRETLCENPSHVEEG